MTMWEINEAAKVITESIDKDAKLIFGAIQDERLKKDELKITVIATGFAGMGPKVVAAEKRSIPVTSAQSSALAGTPFVKSPSSPQPIPVKREASEEEEWGAVPAFLRRKK